MNTHQYITCTGFGGTGSSVISDLMNEFDNVKSCGADFEMTIAFDYGGISDLQHYLVDDLERNKASEGIFLFMKYMAFIRKKYEARFGSDFPKWIKEYIDSLILVEWKGENYMHYFRYSKWQRRFYYRFPKLVQKNLRKLLPAKDTYERTDWIKRDLPMQFPVSEEQFFTSTRAMFQKLLDGFDSMNNYEYLCFDQLLPAYSFKRYLRYFPNMKVIVVDRDPRDLYLLNELYWHEGWIPSGNVDNYIKWFRTIRRNLYRDIEEAGGFVKLIKFENCVYHYDETINDVIEFLGINKEKHTLRQMYFNPRKSIVNTKLWEKNHSKDREIELIEQSLSEFCYHS